METEQRTLADEFKNVCKYYTELTDEEKAEMSADVLDDYRWRAYLSVLGRMGIAVVYDEYFRPITPEQAASTNYENVMITIADEDLDEFALDHGLTVYENCDSCGNTHVDEDGDACLDCEVDTGLTQDLVAEKCDCVIRWSENYQICVVKFN